jgi:hypothetical protein
MRKSSIFNSDCMLPFQGAAIGGCAHNPRRCHWAGILPGFQPCQTQFGCIGTGIWPCAMRSWEYMPDIPPCHIHFSLQRCGLKVQYIPAQWQRLGENGAPRSLRPERAIYRLKNHLLYINIYTNELCNQYRNLPAPDCMLPFQGAAIGGCAHNPRRCHWAGICQAFSLATHSSSVSVRA